MPAVFVHGNPETEAIWDDLVPQLDRDDVVRLSPPGFGAPIPEGFDATRVEYVDWLEAELEKIDGPIDLVGHDWGAGHVMGLALKRPDLIRSWAFDVAGLAHPDYVWHDMAQVWQTDGAGEEAVAGMAGAPKDELAGGFQALGMSESIATQVVAHVNEDMARCILALYRSAAQPALAEATADLSPLRENPGMVIYPEEDHYAGTEEMYHHTAERAGASVTKLTGVGHWWMCQDPTQGAAALNTFWAGLA